MRVIIAYNRKKLAQNWVEMAKDTTPPYGMSYRQSVAQIPSALLPALKKLPHSRATHAALVFMRHDAQWQTTERYARYTEHTLRDAWSENGHDIVNELEYIFGSFTWSRHMAYITNLAVCDDFPERHYFYISMNHALPWNMRTIAHELSHALFTRHYYAACRTSGLSEEQFQDFKEATTVLLNTLPFHRLLLDDDVGYAPHQKMRKEILRLWNHGYSLAEIVDHIVGSYTKKHK